MDSLLSLTFWAFLRSYHLKAAVKLEELREMREKNLITASVYEDQQKALLSGHSAESANIAADTESAKAGTASSSFLDPIRNLRILVKLGCS